MNTHAHVRMGAYACTRCAKESPFYGHNYSYMHERIYEDP